MSTDIVCDAVDSDGADTCGLVRRHKGVHYSLDPIGTFRVRRRCLACRKPTTARLCVCPACLRAGVDPAWAAKERNRLGGKDPLPINQQEPGHVSY